MGYNRTMETNTNQEKPSNVIDMQFYRLRKAIACVKDPLELVILAELALAYVDEAVTIEMVDGEIRFRTIESQAATHEGVV